MTVSLPPSLIAAEKPPIYVATPMCAARNRAAHWRSLRASGVPMTCSWIDEVPPTTSLADQWVQKHREIAGSIGVIVCLEDAELDSRDALTEAALALGMRKPVAILLYGLHKNTVIDQKLGSWVYHPLVSVQREFQEAMQWLRQRQPGPVHRPAASTAAPPAPAASKKPVLAHS